MALPANLNPALNVYEAADQYRAQLLAREEATVADIFRRWMLARSDIERELYELLARVEAALAAGKTPGFGTTAETFSVSLLYRIGRAENLFNAVTENLAAMDNFTGKLVDARVLSEALRAITDAKGLMAFRIRDDGLVVPRQFASLPEAALEKITAFTGPDGPEPLVLRGMGPELVTELKQDMVNAVAKGNNGRTLAVEMKKTVARIIEQPTDKGGLLDRPLYEYARWARTEPLRAYRTSGRETYKANADVVMGWEWHAYPNLRTCPFCLAMDGTRHSSDETMATHPQCRCGQLPITELSGLPPMTGAEFLYNSSAADQDRILGSHAMGELYRSGKVQLEAIPVFFTHEKWGPSGHADSMTGLRQRGIITSADIANATKSSTTSPIWVLPPPNVQRTIQMPR